MSNCLWPHGLQHIRLPEFAQTHAHGVSDAIQPSHPLLHSPAPQHIGHLMTWGPHLPVAYVFCLFILLVGFSRHIYWSGWPFPPPVDHALSELSAMICPSWMVLHSMAHSFSELCKPLCHNKAVIHEGGSSRPQCPHSLVSNKNVTISTAAQAEASKLSSDVSHTTNTCVLSPLDPG